MEPVNEEEEEEEEEKRLSPVVAGYLPNSLIFFGLFFFYLSNFCVHTWLNYLFKKTEESVFFGFL